MASMKPELSNEEARRIALAAQGFADARPTGRVDIRALRRVIGRVGLLQIDSVNVLVRAHYMPLYSRLGPYPRDLLDDAVYKRHELFEAWAHVASLVPLDCYPLLRYQMHSNAPQWRHFRHWAEANKEYVDAVLAEVRERGPLSAKELEDPGWRRGSWWMRSKGKQALEWHFRCGNLMASDRPNFERVYDVTERVLPADVLDQEPVPEREAQREFLMRAARSHGVGTAKDLADYYRLPILRSRELLKELVAEGALREVSVEGWRDPAYLHPEATAPRSIKARALLTPFDPVVWERSRAERLFNFTYQIEIYVPEKKRQYGYYVLPFLLDGELVGRVDLKADRTAGKLHAKGVFIEEGQDERRVAGELAEELRVMADWLELDGVRAGRRGNLSGALRAALAR